MKKFLIIFSAVGVAISVFLVLLFHPLYGIAGGLFLFQLAFLYFQAREKAEVPQELEKAKILDLEDIEAQVIKIRDFLQKIVKHNEIDLTQRIQPSKGVFVSLEDYINFLLNSLTEVISWIVDRSEKLSIFSAEINFYTQASEKKSEEQILYAHKIIDLVQHLLNSFRNIVDKSKEAFMLNDEAQSVYREGQAVVEKTTAVVRDLGETMNHMIRYLENLQKFTTEMGQVLEIIMEMAQKTNMLSLNASIEAARAGEAGKGFKIVAREIQRFSQGTTEASKKITGDLKQLNREMRKSFEMVEKSKKVVQDVIHRTEILQDYFQKLSCYITQALDSTRNISNIAAKEVSKVEDIDRQITTIQRTITDFKNEFRFLAGSAENIIRSAENIARVVNNFQMDNYQTVAKKIMRQHLESIVDIFERKVEQNILSREEIFDTHYVKISGTNPPQYHTSYDALVESEIQEVLEKLKEDLSAKAPLYSKKFLACAITDENGYTPTHLKSYSRKVTGNYEYDLTYCRDKRIYNDPVSLKAAKNKTDFLLQVYMRDDGTQNIDLSMPIKIFNRHWGCLRVGYTLLSEH